MAQRSLLGKSECQSNLTIGATESTTDSAVVLAALGNARKRLGLGGKLRRIPPDFNARVQATTDEWLDAIAGQAANLAESMKTGRVTRTQAQSWLSFQTLSIPANFERALLHAPEPADVVEEHGVRYRIDPDGSRRILLSAS